MMAKKLEDQTFPSVSHVLVVGFHHQKGSTVEFSYPPLCGDEHHQDPETQSITNFLPLSWKYLPYLALPDGCHNYEEDSVYFILPSTSSPHQQAIFGVACCRQVEARELAVVSKDVTRSSVQKSVCILSRYPVFGFIEAKMNLITHAYFNIKDFSDTSILQEAYENLNATLNAKSLQQIVNVGLSPKNVVSQFHHRILQIFKALLLQKKVLVYGSPAKKVSSVVLSIASLFPNTLECLSTDTSQQPDEHGFPLKIFPNPEDLQPYVCLQQMELVASRMYLLAGVVNPLFEKQHDKFCDVFVSLPDSLITIHDEDLKSCLHLTAADLRFCSLLSESVEQPRVQEADTAHYADWHGSEEWVLSQFKAYLLSLLVTSVKEDTALLNDFNSNFITAWLKGPVFRSWQSHHEMSKKMMEKYECAHICSRRGLSLSDLKLRLIAQASDYGLGTPSKEHAAEEAQRLAAHVSTSVSSMWENASSKLYTWWSASTKDEKS